MATNSCTSNRSVCLFGARCSRNGTCLCPDLRCADRISNSVLAHTALDRVCASDLVMYATECHMRAAMCAKQQRLTVRPVQLCEGTRHRARSPPVFK